jgi:hypothetical protein
VIKLKAKLSPSQELNLHDDEPLSPSGVDFLDKVGNFFYHMLTFYSDFHFDGEFSEIAIQIVGN